MQDRLTQLDILRAFCVFGVLGRHLSPAPVEINGFLNYLTTFWNNGGWVGVDTFFVLSGFLISTLIFREYQSFGNVRLKRFLIRRGMKIYPPFYILIIATIFINPLLGIKVPLIPFLAEIFFVQNLLWGRLWDHTWSLAVEEHFYIGFAILVAISLRFKYFLKNKPFSLIPYLFIFIAITCLILRLLMAIYKGTNISPTPFRIDSLFFGVLISYYWNFHNLGESEFIKRYKTWFIIIGILMILPMFFFFSITNPVVFVIGLTTNYIAAGLLLIGFLKTDFSSNFLSKTLAYIGKYSYSIYLWHLPVQIWIRVKLFNSLGLDNWFWYSGSYLFLSIILGIAFSKLIEYPVLNIRDKYFPRVDKIS